MTIYIKNKILIKFKSKLPKLAEINKGERQGCRLSSTLFNTIQSHYRLGVAQRVPGS